MRMDMNNESATINLANAKYEAVCRLYYSQRTDVQVAL